MTEFQQANPEAKPLAKIDELTQIANRRPFYEYLEQEWLRLAGEQAPLSLILCNLDFFKRYNDNNGFNAGDKCLQTVAQAICQAVKHPAALVARYGGDEFMIILPNTTLEEAIHQAEMIREVVATLQIPHPESGLEQYLTVSLGVTSTIPQEGSAANDLIIDVDKALDQAKTEGRNRVASYMK